MKKPKVLRTDYEASDGISSKQNHGMLDRVGPVGILLSATNTNETTGVHEWMKGNQRA